jgi:hypothetical protein
MSSVDWIVCQSCSLRHAARVDGLCPRCRNPAAGSLVPGGYGGSYGGVAMPIDNGSFILGFLLAFFLGIWGWLGARFMGKPETQRGATGGCLTRVIVAVGLMALIALLDQRHP